MISNERLIAAKNRYCSKSSPHISHGNRMNATSSRTASRSKNGTHGIHRSWSCRNSYFRMAVVDFWWGRTSDGPRIFRSRKARNRRLCFWHPLRNFMDPFGSAIPGCGFCQNYRARPAKSHCETCDFWEPKRWIFYQCTIWRNITESRSHRYRNRRSGHPAFLRVTHSHGATSPVLLEKLQICYGYSFRYRGWARILGSPRVS